MSTGLLERTRHMALGDGRSLRLLTALEVLEARREAGELAQDGRERALCGNACLLARALERKGRPVFADGRAVLAGMTAGEIERLARKWDEFRRRENPSPEDGEERAEALKKSWSTRLMSAFAGACSGHLGRCLRRREQKK